MTLSPRAIEAAARAICVAQGYNPKSLDDIGSISHLPLWKDKLAAAQAALTAALAVDGLCLVPKEPTEDMLDFGSCYEDPFSLYKKYPIFEDGDISREVYRAMIAAASDGDPPREDNKK